MADDSVTQPSGSEPKKAAKKTASKKAATPRGDGPDPALDLEFGIERPLPFSGWSTDNEILNNNPIPIDSLVEMRRRDGQARALVRLFILPIISAMADGEWIAPDGDEEAGPEVEYANQMWNLPPQAGGMSQSKTVFLKKSLQGLTDGFACFEEVRHVPDDGPLKGKIAIRKMAYRDPRTVRFMVDEKGGFNGVRQITNLNGKTIDVRIPKEKVWFWTCNAEENPFYGVSMFESAYYHYETKKKLYYIAHLAAQFAAVPGRVGEIPKGADPRHVTAFKQSLMNFAFNTALVAPEGFKVTPFNGNSGFNFINLIDHHNHQMSKSVIASFLDSEQRTTLIEVGTTDPSTDFFILALEALMDELAESWSTHVMPKYIDWNFGTKKYPVFKFGQLSETAKTTIKDLFQTVVVSSVLNSTPEFVRELEKKLSSSLDLDIDYEEIEKQEKEAAEQAAQQADQEAQGLLADPNADPNAPGGPPGGPAAPPGTTPPGGAGAIADPNTVPLANPTIDDLVAAAQALLIERPEVDDDEDEV